MINKTLRIQFAQLNREVPAFKSVLMVDSLRQVNEFISLVTIPWWITSRGSSKELALFSAIIAIATFLLVPLTAPIGDRVCKQKQIARSLLGQALISAAFSVLTSLHLFSLPLIIALACMQVAARSFIDPACATILPELVAADRLPAAIQIRKICMSVSGILGPLIAGAAIHSLGVEGAMRICFGLYLVALFFAAKVPKTTLAGQRLNGARLWLARVRMGLATKWLVPMERGWTIVNFVMWIFQGPAVGMLIPIKVHAAGLGGNWVGIAMGALSAGVLAGSLFGAQYLVDRFGRYTVRVGIGFFEAMALTAVGLSASPYLMTAALVVAGFCNASLSLVGATHRALAIPRDFRVRMHAASTMTTQIAGALGPAIVGLALVHWSVNAVYASFGVLMGMSVLGFLFVPRLKEFFSHSHDEVVDWYAREYPAAFRSESA
jgi:MFS family permease